MSYTNMPKNGDATMNLLIVLTKSAQEKISAAEFELNQIEKELSGLSCVKLFHYRREEKPPCMVMPIANAEYALVLTHPASDEQGEERDFFLCVDFWDKHLNFDGESKDRYCELPPDVKCRVILPRNINRYQGEAVAHAEIWEDVRSKKISKGHEGRDSVGEDSTSRLWSAYLKLCEKYIERMRIKLCAESMEIKNDNTLRVLLSTQSKEKSDIEEEEEKIDAAKGENARILTPGYGACVAEGKIGRRIGQNLEIRLDREETERMKKQLLNLTKPESNYRFIKNSPGIKTDKEQFLCNGELFFTADVIKPKIDKTDKKNDGSSKENCVILSSVELCKFCFQVDYFGDEYQAKVMKRAFREVRRLPIWEVLSEKRVAHLPDLDEGLPEDALSVDSRLNKEQKAAVRGALAAPELFLIWGPPGTGKTEVIQEIAKQEAIRGGKTLICSQANLAVDNALARLDGVADAFPFRVVKEGYKLEGEDTEKVACGENSPSHFLTRLKRRLIDKSAGNDLYRSFLSAVEKSERVLGKKKKSDSELREFHQLARLYKRRINIVGCTLMMAGKLERWREEKENKSPRKSFVSVITGIDKFDTVIVDEVSKATPPELFVPITRLKKEGRLILVGDHKQLPPLFKLFSQDDQSLEDLAEETGIPKEYLDPDETIFGKLWDEHGKGFSRDARQMLRKQYRMHPKVQRLIEQFYQDSEQTIECGLTGEDIKNMSFSDDADGFFRTPAIWADVYGKEERDGTSFYNEGEIEKVGEILAKLAAMENGNLSVGVITFYGAQLRKLRERHERKFAFQDDEDMDEEESAGPLTHKLGAALPAEARGAGQNGPGQNNKRFAKGKLVFGTVDRFQGRECDVVICSLVRKNEHGNIGFASKINRINVAFSRARRALVIVGNSQLFCYESRNDTEERKKALRAYKQIYDACRKE